MGIFDLDGELIDYSAYGGSGIELSYQILLLEDESILLVGTSNSNDFDVPDNQGDKDILLIKLKKLISASIEIEQETDEIVSFPNPANEFINIEIPSDYLEGDLMIFNTLGRLVFSKKINSIAERVDLINLPEEIYFIEILNKNKSKKEYEKILIKTNR